MCHLPCRVNAGWKTSFPGETFCKIKANTFSHLKTGSNPATSKDVFDHPPQPHVTWSQQASLHPVYLGGSARRHRFLLSEFSFLKAVRRLLLLGSLREHFLVSESFRIKVQCSERSDGWRRSGSICHLRAAKPCLIMIPKGTFVLIKPTSERSKVSSASLKCLCRFVCETF